MKKRLKNIKALILDVDGVLTDGKIIYDSKGNEIKHFDVQDGFGIIFFQRAGYKTAIISARYSKTVTLRAKDLKIHRTIQNAFPKTAAFEKILKEFNLKTEEVCFIGDDLPDLPVLKKVGFSVGVANASIEVKKHVHYVTKRAGGHGAVREVIEMILQSQNKWDDVLKGCE